MFGNQSSTVDELKEFIVQYLKAFDPADPYWKVWPCGLQDPQLIGWLAGG